MTDNLTPEELDEIERQEQEAFRNAVNGVETEDEEDVVEDQVQPDEPAREVTRKSPLQRIL